MPRFVYNEPPRFQSSVSREKTPGINKYYFCEECEHIHKDSQLRQTCIARFDPHEKKCPKAELFEQRERAKRREENERFNR